MADNVMLFAALFYAEKQGFSVFPLLEKQKIPAISGGLNSATKKPEKIREWWGSGSCNIGIRTGAESGFWVLDIDGHAGESDIAALEFEHGQLPQTATQKTSHGKHLLFAYPQDRNIGNRAKLIRHPEAGGLDVRGNGGYIVAAPSIHPETLAPYEWIISPEDLPPQPAPPWLLDLVAPPENATKPHILQPSIYQPQTRIGHSTSPDSIIKDQLAAVANAPEGARNHTLNIAAMKVGKVIQASDMSETEAKALLAGAAKQAGLGASETEKTINSGFNFGAKAPYLYGQKKGGGQETVKKNFPVEAAAIQDNPEKHGGAEPSPFRFLSIPDMEHLPDPEWIIDGVFARKSFGIIYGPPKRGKTFVALDMALSVAAGLEDWQGRPLRTGGVLYIAGEGVGGLKKRVKAWLNHHHVSSAIPFRILASTVNFMLPEQVTALLAAIDALGEQFSMVIVDTVARAMLGGDENAAKEMGLFVASCDIVKEHTGACVVGIHHSGKNSDNGMRGSSALLGAVDTVLKIDKDEDTVTIVMEEQKDAEPLEDIILTLQSVPVGLSGSSLVPVAGEATASTEPRKGDLSPRAKLAYQFLTDCVQPDCVRIRGCATVPKEEWRAACIKRGLSDGDREQQRKAFNKYSSKLQELGYVAYDDELVIVL